MNQIEIIQTIFNIHRRDIPKIYWADFLNLKTLDPGINGTAVRLALDNLDVIKEGRILVLSGPIGCGKTLAAFILALYWEWINFIEPSYKGILSRDEDYYSDEFIEYKILDADFKTRAFKLSVIKYSQMNSIKYKFYRAFDILKDAIRADSRVLANYRGLVIIDDLGREYFTDKGFGISEWDAFFDIRYSELLPTLITTNLTRDEFIEKYNQRIYDRMRQVAEWITINEKSMRG